ncbi:DUF4838 domain-containing protein [Paenibacillus sp. J2TS4]|uniref:DUF4838 domain-containing protein n=1 Tax=Paenibacillus sp. J2TS4 TaxID=2807194 RepID=UPI001B15F172|nr:DUF4838 domain-containing protein [Paenibacillus sp. J2TS4]GIP31232.1 hypothetical protein J2TS4_04420 [Paenibacillus sp. J2TS4]
MHNKAAGWRVSAVMVLYLVFLSIGGVFGGSVLASTVTEDFSEIGTTQAPLSVSVPSPMRMEDSPLLKIVENGQSHALIVIPDDNNVQVKAAAETLAEYVKKATGAALTVKTAAEWAASGSQHDNDATIYVGMAANAEDPAIPNMLQGMDDDGFVILSDENSTSIIGPSSWGTEYGVYEFLERYVGVRWLMPGPDGEDVPQSSDLFVPLETIKQEPAFLSRQFDWWFMDKYYPDWVRHNRLKGRYEFAHNMSNLFPYDKYKDTHPDFYPPGNSNVNKSSGWNPCFKAPGIVEEAIKNINNYFDQHPEATSYSLGVNDTGGFCEADPLNPHYPGQLNTNGTLNMSEIYFDWVNQVVEGVLQTHPDKYFGVYAYSYVYEPPATVTVHPRVIVYITEDRMSWGDPSFETQGKDITERWRAAAPSLGFYEYLWGNPYMLPRTFFNLMADNYRYSYEQGVKAHFAELSANWGEGPKAWLSAKLQWNPNQDENALLKEWYERAVGPAAAEDLEAYYDFWNEFWSNRIFSSQWYTNWSSAFPRTNYMRYNDSTYLNAVTEEDMAECRRLLESVVAKAQTDKQKARANVLLQAFEYYEASALSYPREKIVPLPTNEMEGNMLLDDVVQQIQLAEDRVNMVDEFSVIPLLRLSDSALSYKWSGITGSSFLALAEWLGEQTADSQVVQRVSQMAQRTETNLGYYMQVLAALAEHKVSEIQNRSFESGDGGVANFWSYWTNDPSNAPDKVMERSQNYTYSGSYAIRAKGIMWGGPQQVIPITEPGRYAAVAHYYTPEGQATNGTVQLVMKARDSQNNVLSTYTSLQKQAAPTSGRWSLVEMMEEIPSIVNGKPVTSVELTVRLFEFGGQQEVYIDDVELYRLNTNHDLRNFSFEAGNAVKAPPWKYNFTVEGGELRRTKDIARTGDYSLQAKGVLGGGPYQQMQLDAGRYLMSVHYYTAPGSDTTGDVQISVNLRDDNNKIVKTISSDRILAKPMQGNWAKLEYEVEIPDKVGNSTITSIQCLVILKNFAGNDVIYLDDFAIGQVVDDIVPNSTVTY